MRPAAQAEQEEASISSLYLPLSQAEHDDDADPLYVPTPQLEQLDAAAPLYLPLAHDEQLDSPGLLIFPPSHDKQLACPVACWYFPASQSSQDVEALEGCTVPPSQAVQLL